MNHHVVVVSPGAPEMRHMAEAFAEVGALRAYVAPFAPTPSEIEASPLSSLGIVGRGVVSQLRRRVVSEQVGRSDRFQAGRAADIAGTVAIRLRLAPQHVERLAAWRNQAIQARVARLLETGDTDLMIPAGTAMTPLEHARHLGIRGWLDCPTANHQYAARLLIEELQLEPDFAATMQYPASSARVANQLNREIELADDLLVLSSFQLRTYLEEGVDPRRLHLLPLGVNVELFKPSRRERGDFFTIGFVGQVTQRKGISYLVRAFEALRTHGLRLLVVGRPVGPRRPWLREGVEHHRAVPRAILPQFYEQMDVFVLPSLIEGFGLTALEAMACGVPVIVSENTFGSDIVIDGDNGYVVPIRDSQAIIDRIRLLIDNESLRSAMSVKARATAERYTWQAYGRKVVHLVNI